MSISAGHPWSYVNAYSYLSRYPLTLVFVHIKAHQTYCEAGRGDCCPVFLLNFGGCVRSSAFCIAAQSSWTYHDPRSDPFLQHRHVFQRYFYVLCIGINVVGLYWNKVQMKKDSGKTRTKQLHAEVFCCSVLLNQGCILKRLIAGK